MLQRDQDAYSLICGAVPLGRLAIIAGVDKRTRKAATYLAVMLPGAAPGMVEFKPIAKLIDDAEADSVRIADPLGSPADPENN